MEGEAQMELSIRRSLLGAILLLSWARVGTCQSVPGIQMFSTNENGVDVATGNVIFNNIPLRTKSGKIPFWSKIVGTSGMGVPPLTAQWTSLLEFTYEDPTETYFSVSVVKTIPCTYDNKSYPIELVNTPIVTDSTGASHGFGGTGVQWEISDGPSGSTCINTQGTYGPYAATDGSGYSLIITNGNVTIYYPNGDFVSGTCSSGFGGCNVPLKLTDPDGATIVDSLNSSGAFQITDSLDTTLATFTGDPAGLPGTMSYADVNGNQQEYKMTVSTLTIATNFGCVNSSGAKAPVDIPPTEENLLTGITLPNGAQYTFAYEPTPGKSGDYTGRIAKITLPSGGSVSYAYSGGNDGINCTYTTVPELTVTVTDPYGQTGVYTYTSSLSTAPASSVLPYQDAYFTVTKTDPVGNQTVYHFVGEFQTEKQVYQGSATGTPLSTTITCYNGANSTQAACISPSSLKLPITR
jgi:hypothetical protein